MNNCTIRPNRRNGFKRKANKQIALFAISLQNFSPGKFIEIVVRLFELFFQEGKIAHNGGTVAWCRSDARLGLSLFIITKQHEIDITHKVVLEALKLVLALLVHLVVVLVVLVLVMFVLVVVLVVLVGVLLVLVLLVVVLVVIHKAIFSVCMCGCYD